MPIAYRVSASVPPVPSPLTLTCESLSFTAAPADKKPTYCSQKYVGRISLATEELQAALNAYGRTHSSAIEEARQEVVDFYEIRTKELGSTIQDQQQVIKNLEDSLSKLGDQITSKQVELKDLTAEHAKAKSAGAAAEKLAEEQKVCALCWSTCLLADAG